MDLPDTSKLQTAVGTVFSIHSAPASRGQWLYTLMKRGGKGKKRNGVRGDNPHLEVIICESQLCQSREAEIGGQSANQPLVSHVQRLQRWQAWHQSQKLCNKSCGNQKIINRGIMHTHTGHKRRHKHDHCSTGFGRRTESTQSSLKWAWSNARLKSGWHAHDQKDKVRVMSRLYATYVLPSVLCEFLCCLQR